MIQFVGRPSSATRKASMPAGGCIARQPSIDSPARATATALDTSPGPSAHNAANPAAEERRCPAMAGYFVEKQFRRTSLVE
jgi:hypothetical protein